MRQIATTSRPDAGSWAPSAWRRSFRSRQLTSFVPSPLLSITLHAVSNNEEAKSELTEVRDAVRQLQTAALAREKEAQEVLLSVAPRHLDSARNLVHYSALREVDLRELQRDLSALGLSSLGRAEAHVLQNLDAVEAVLSYLSGISDNARAPFSAQPAQRIPADQLDRNLIALLGEGRPDRRSRIMVTAPTQAAEDPELIEDLLRAGMDILRINCAKDSPDTWEQTLSHLRRGEERLGLSCLVSCDLPGPKVRTAPIAGKGKIKLRQGDRLWLTRSQKAGKGPRSHKGNIDVAFVGCAVPEVLSDLRPDHRVFFDDGKFGSRVLEVDEKGALLEITHAPPQGGNLKPDKGINLPDTRLSLPALTPADYEALDFATEHADLVAQSFLRTGDDVHELIGELRRRDAADLGLILKLETPTALSQLKEVLLAGLSHRRVGAMVARGDLALEVGFERLAEAQEEILWMCEAAHVPVIWATQVLETMAKEGMPTRAEVTDAAMASRAECVMLNKGDYILPTVRFLADVLGRMESHQQKKRAQLRKLDWGNE